MVGELTGLDQLIGGAINNSFGTIGVAILVILFFLMIGVATRAGWEVTIIFVFAAVMLLSIYGVISGLWFVAILLIGSILIYLVVIRLFLR